jgi:hypothetical protein
VLWPTDARGAHWALEVDRSARRRTTLTRSCWVRHDERLQTRWGDAETKIKIYCKQALPGQATKSNKDHKVMRRTARQTGQLRGLERKDGPRQPGCDERRKEYLKRGDCEFDCRWFNDGGAARGRAGCVSWNGGAAMMASSSSWRKKVGSGGPGVPDGRHAWPWRRRGVTGKNRAPRRRRVRRRLCPRDQPVHVVYHSAAGVRPSTTADILRR